MVSNIANNSRQLFLSYKFCKRSLLAEKLNDEEKEILTELVDTLFDEASVDAYQKSECGFQLGVLMMVEVFAEQNTFL